MRHSALIPVLILLASGCVLPAPTPGPQYPNAPDPNDRFVVERDSAPLQQQAKTTLLEENEKLRDMLGRTLSEKRAVERQLEKSQVLAADLDEKVTQQTDSIASLSEQVQSLETRVQTSERRAEVLAKERKSLAEMYGTEKKQRLAFEKELLEREIADRTYTKDRP